MTANQSACFHELDQIRHDPERSEKVREAATIVFYGLLDLDELIHAEPTVEVRA